VGMQIGRSASGLRRYFKRSYPVISSVARNLIPIRFQRSVFSDRKAIFQIA